MRDTLISKSEYWTNYLVANAESDKRWLNRLERTELRYDQILMAYASLNGNHLNRTSALYSSGAEMQEVAAAARKLLLEAYPQFISVCREDPAKAKRDYGGGWADRYRYLSLAILIDLSLDDSAIFIDALDFWPERDKGWELMIAGLGYKDRPKAKELRWPQAYESLYLAMDLETEDYARQGYIKNFLKTWLPEMRRGTAGGYESPDKTKNYHGIWCFEAAAATVMMDIDDTSFRDHEHYPKDFADWARYQKKNA